MNNPLLIIVGLIFGLILFIAMLTRPFWYITGFLFLRPLFEELAQYEISKGYPIITGLLSGLNVICLFVWLINGKVKTLKYSNAVPIYLLALVATLSFVNSPFLSISIAHLLRLLTWLTVSVLVFNAINNSSDITKVLAAISFSSVIPMMIGYKDFLMGGTGRLDPFTGMYRITSVFRTVNAWAIFLCLSFFATGLLFVRARQAGMRLMQGTCVLMGASLLSSLMLTYHRGSWIALSIAVFVIVCLLRQFKLAFIVSVFSVLIGLLLHKEITHRFEDLYVVDPYRVSSLQTRVILWKTLIKLIPEHPFVGHGLGCSKEIVTGMVEVPMVPHNDYLRLMLETGFLSVVIYIWFLGGEIMGCIKRLRFQESRTENTLLIGCLSYFIIISFFQNIIYDVLNMSIFVSMLAIYKKSFILEKSV